jgi:guanine deaminase
VPTRTLTGCLALLGVDPKPGDVAVDIVIDGKTIADIRPTGLVPPPGDVIDASRHLVTPGLINGHHHSAEHFHKGRYDNLPLELWMNLVRPLKPLPLTPRRIYLRTMVGAIEALRTGTTTLVDDLNVSPVVDPDHVAAVFQAYEDIGIRALVGPTLFDKPFFRGMPYVDEEFPEQLLRELDGVKATPPEEILRFVRGLARTRHPARNRVGYIVAPSAPQRCTRAFLMQSRALADEFDLPLMIHVQETRLQVVTGGALFGSTMVEYLDRLGFLKPKTSLIHAVWLNPGEIERIARSGASVQHNPASNLKLGSGLQPLREILDAGINVSMGSDGLASIETVDMHKVMLTGALISKLRGADYTRWVGAGDVWRAATVGGAIAMGRGRELGAVEKGRIADLVAYRRDRIPLVPLNDPVRQLVYAETGASVDMVFVDGEPVIMNGAFTRIDEARLLTEIAAAHADLAPMIAESEAALERLREPYERIYRRCLATPIADDTFPALMSTRPASRNPGEAGRASA